MCVCGGGGGGGEGEGLYICGGVIAGKVCIPAKCSWPHSFLSLGCKVPIVFTEQELS